MDTNIIKQLTEKYPFMTLCIYAGNEYIGIVQNRDDIVTTIYDYGNIPTPELKGLFIELAHTWWWESNRSIPINIFLRNDWAPFRSFRRTFINKDLEIVCGPACSLIDLSRKKNKKKSITLVRKEA